MADLERGGFAENSKSIVVFERRNFLAMNMVVPCLVLVALVMNTVVK